MKTGQYFQVASQVNNLEVSEDSASGLDVGQFLATLRRKLLLIIGITAAVTAAAGAKSLSDTPIYSASFQILVRTSSAETEVVSSVPGTLANGDTTATAKAVNADLLTILKSPKVLVPVFKKFESKYPNLCGGPTPISNSNSPDKIANNPCYQGFTGALNIAVLGKESNILLVSYQGLDSDQVQTFLKLISDAYLDYSLKSRQADVQRAIKFVEDKLPSLRNRVETLQGQMQQLRLKNDLIDPVSRGAQLSSQVTAFSQQQLAAQVDLEQIKAQYASLRAQLAQQPTESAASSALSSNPRYEALLNQLLELDGKIAATSTIFLETTPDMQVLREQRQNLLVLLAREGDQAQREVVSKIQELQSREQALQQTVGTLNAGVRELSGISRQYTDIERELQISTDNLNQFLTKQQALQIDVAQREVPWEVLTPPTDPTPGSASISRNLILGAILGLLLGTGAALAVDKLTDVIYTPDELKRLTGLPLLGTIPFTEMLKASGSRSSLTAALQQVSASITQASDDSAENSNVRPYGEASFFETFRLLYTNIRLLNSDVPIRSLVISSTTSLEGKSTVAACVAQAAAAMGQRVLLVDADLRHPQLHEYLDLPNTDGLMNVISGERSLKDVIRRSPLEANMYVLTAGPIPPDPTRSLSSQKMHHLMEHVQNNFDFVIYDTSPLLGFADAYLIAAHTNGIMLVAEPGRLKRSLLEQALDRLKVSSTSVLGVVLQKMAVS
jgi:succinoglycan biosynthesis transport protein ExoP